MNPDFSHLRLTVVDFMGVFLPGVIWAFLTATLNRVFTAGLFDEVTPAVIAREFLTATNLETGFYVACFLFALILGYVAKTVAIPPSERIARLIDAPAARLRQLLARKASLKTSRNIRSSDYRFPYHALHSQSPPNYYGKILNFVAARLGVNWQEIPRSQIFATCKRMLKLYAPRLWEEAEYREAEVRLLASLFLASIFNLTLAITRSVTAVSSSSNWILVSIATTLLLCLAFRSRRRLEVESVYFAFLSSLPLIPAPGQPSEANEAILDRATG